MKVSSSVRGDHPHSFWATNTKGSNSSVYCQIYKNYRLAYIRKTRRKKTRWLLVSQPRLLTGYVAVLQVLSPFYIFQLFSMIIWYYDHYEMYASCILFIATVSIVITIWETRKVTIGSTFLQSTTVKCIEQ